jgi:hypothetical protein
VPELEPNAKFALAMKLSASGWLPVTESAALFGVDKDKIQETLLSSKAANDPV